MAVAASVLLLIRPITGMLGLAGSDAAPSERLIFGLIVLASILMHGLTVTPVMRGLDRQQGRDPDSRST